MKDRVIYIWFTWIFLAIAIMGLVGFYYWHFAISSHPQFTTDPTKWGAFGDFIGGIANPIIGLFTITLIIVTIRLTSKALEQNEKALKQAQRALEQGEKVIKQNADELRASREEQEKTRKAQQMLAEIENNNLENRRLNQDLDNSRRKIDILLIDLKRKLEIKWITRMPGQEGVALNYVINDMYGSVKEGVTYSDSVHTETLLYETLVLMSQLATELAAYSDLCGLNRLSMSHEAEGFLRHISIFLKAKMTLREAGSLVGTINDSTAPQGFYAILDNKDKHFFNRYIGFWTGLE